eukprot:Hpha_TRINITY_DN16956_c1_g4::TRINITY_DN16956_c1_g4_i1::g.54187::m.54187
MVPAPRDSYEVGFVQHRGSLRAVLRPAAGGDFFSAFYNCLLLRSQRPLPTLRLRPGLHCRTRKQVHRPGGWVWGRAVTWPEGTRAVVESEFSESEGCVKVRLPPKDGEEGESVDMKLWEMRVDSVPLKELNSILVEFIEMQLRRGLEPHTFAVYAEYWSRLLGPVERGLLPVFDSVDSVRGPQPLAGVIKSAGVRILHASLPDPERDPAAAVYAKGHTVPSMRRFVAAVKRQGRAAVTDDPGAWEVKDAAGISVAAGDGKSFRPDYGAVDVSDVQPLSPAALA